MITFLKFNFFDNLRSERYRHIRHLLEMSDNQGRNNYAPSTNSTIALASASQARQIYVNMPLPDDQLDSARKAQGRYVPKHTYETNR
jgi:hypothetical protein